MKTLYLDIFSGISGDMLIGALIDLGVDAQQLEHELGKLGLHDYHLHISRAQKTSIEGVKFDVHLEKQHTHEHTHSGDEHHVHSHSGGGRHEHSGPHEHGLAESGHDHQHGRDFTSIRRLINQSALSDWVKHKAIAVFQRLAVAEGKVHGVPSEKVHFHEVGAVDSIVDIVGACVGLELLGKPRVVAGPAIEGTGFIDCAHGRFPIPAPATLAILGARGIPLSQCEEPHELITPTGAALLAELAEGFGPMQNLVAEKIGFGLGQRDNKTRPNVLRAVLGTASIDPATHDWHRDTIAVLEANLDDLNPEILGYFSAKALAAGALDVFFTPIQMKKNRPGSLLTVLCAEADQDRFCELILRETSTFGVRRSLTERRKLLRELITVSTPYGEVTVKVGKLDGQVVHASPEFDSCKNAAERSKVPLKKVYDAATKARVS